MVTYCNGNAEAVQPQNSKLRVALLLKAISLVSSPLWMSPPPHPPLHSGRLLVLGATPLKVLKRKYTLRGFHWETLTHGGGERIHKVRNSFAFGVFGPPQLGVRRTKSSWSPRGLAQGSGSGWSGMVVEWNGMNSCN